MPEPPPPSGSSGGLPPGHPGADPAPGSPAAGAAPGAPTAGPPPRSKQRRRRIGLGTIVFGAIITVLIVFAVLQFVLDVFGTKDPKIGDHWHVQYGVDICGQFLPNLEEFEKRAGSDGRAGIHTHGDGFIHIHPFTEDETASRATIGRFFELGGGEVSEDSIRLFDGAEFTNGAVCPDGRPASVRWAVNDEEQDGNVGDFHPEDGDVVTIAFLPEGDPVPPPPDPDAEPVEDG